MRYVHRFHLSAMVGTLPVMHAHSGVAKASPMAVGAVLACLAWSGAAAPGMAQERPGRWRLGRSPSLVIGSANGAEATIFQSVVNVRLLDDGGIAVADDGLLNVRVYGETGRLRVGFGGRGGGPGEFRSIDGFWLTSSGDLGVWDPDGSRISTFEPDGTLLSSRRLSGSPAVGNTAVFFGAMSNDEVVLGALTTPKERRPGELLPDPWLLSTYRLSGEFVRQMGHVRGMWRYSGNPSPFSPVPWVGLFRDSLLVSDGYEPTVGVRSPYGQEVRRISVGSAVRVAREEWAELRDSLEDRGSHSTVSQFFVQLLDRGVMPFQSRAPAHAGLLTDDVGVVWLKKYRPARDAIWLRTHSTRSAPGGVWMAVRPSDGVVLAEVSMPASFTPMDIRGDRMAGVSTDPWGVQRVTVYPLVRSSTGG